MSLPAMAANLPASMLTKTSFPVVAKMRCTIPAQRLEDAVATFAYLATECDVDIEKHCSNVEPGEGRIIDCMEPHLKTVSKRCQKAMQDVGLENK
jgi:hypothetical protein